MNLTVLSRRNANYTFRIPSIYNTIGKHDTLSFPKLLKRTEISIVYLQTRRNHFPVTIVSRNKITAIIISAIVLLVAFQAIATTCQLSRVVDVHSSALSQTIFLPLSRGHILLKRTRTSTLFRQDTAIPVPLPWCGCRFEKIFVTSSWCTHISSIALPWPNFTHFGNVTFFNSEFHWSSTIIFSCWKFYVDICTYCSICCWKF